MHGIEFYPQKEFDEDLEDKTENDKIRVGVSLSSSHPPSQASWSSWEKHGGPLLPFVCFLSTLIPAPMTRGVQKRGKPGAWQPLHPGHIKVYSSPARQTQLDGHQLKAPGWGP